MKLEQKKIAIIGLGYVGLPLAVRFGMFRDVIGFDIDTKRINELVTGKDVTNECSKEQILASSNLTFTSKSSEISNCKIFIVTVPTPVDNAHRPDLRMLKNACQTVGKLLKKDDLIIFESTVFPGATEEICVPELEYFSCLKFNQDFFCGYSPERVNPGDKINTLEKIAKITSGSTPEIAAEVDKLYAEIIEAGTWMVGSIKVAEAAKIIENTQRDLNIAFVNELSVIFERLGIDTLEVLEAAGSKWNFIPFRPGMVGGHCIGVDPYYLTHKAEEVGYNPQVILAGRRINDNMARYAARNVIKRMLLNKIDVANARVAILGITFKENCPDIRNSKIIDMVKEFESWGVECVIIDDWASSEQCYNNFNLKITKLEHCPKVESIVVAVGHDEFRKINPTKLFDLCNPKYKPVLGDLKSIYERSISEAAGFEVFRL